MYKYFSVFIFIGLFYQLTAQIPHGFTTAADCHKQGAPLKILLEEPDSKQFVLSLRKGIVVNEGGIVTAEGLVLTDTETFHKDQHRLVKRGENLESILFRGKLAVISSPGQENWYHWLYQVLPRLKIISDAELPFDKIYINNLHYPWQKESLKLILEKVGLSEEHLLMIDGDIAIQADELLVPAVPFIPFKSPILPEWLKTFLIDTFLTDKTLPSFEKLYISRAKANNRRILNEQELTAFLTKHGFHTVILEDLPIAEQARLFYHAKCIVSPHGSGLANLLFCQPQTKIIEIDHALAGTEQRSYYQKLADLMGCRYQAYYPDIAAEDHLDDDLWVNPQDLLL